MAPLYLDALVTGRPWSFEHNEVPGSVLATVVRCVGDDAWAAVEIEDLDDLRILAEVLERPEFAVTTMQEARGLSDGVDRHLKEWAASRTPMQVSLVLQRAGLAAAPVQTPKTCGETRSSLPNAFVEVEHPDVGLLEQLQSPDLMSMTPGRVHGRSRRLGEDTFEVLEDWLGIEGSEVELLRVNGAVYQVTDNAG